MQEKISDFYLSVDKSDKYTEDDKALTKSLLDYYGTCLLINITELKGDLGKDDNYYETLDMQKQELQKYRDQIKDYLK